MSILLSYSLNIISWDVIRLQSIKPHDILYDVGFNDFMRFLWLFYQLVNFIKMVILHVPIQTISVYLFRFHSLLNL